MEALTNNSLKEYYIKLLKLQQNTLNMMTAMKQSLSTTASEITINMVSEDDVETSVRIPSFLYLENKLEQLETNFNNLFQMPNSGEAWFSKSSDMFKLEMVKSSIAPLRPLIDTSNVIASITDNNFLKDLVSPKTYLKLNITNLPDNIDEMFMRKIVFYNYSAYKEIADANCKSYDEYVAALYNLTKGVDYDEYDSKIALPTRYDNYVSNFKITKIPTLETGNPWIDTTVTYSDGHEHLSYKLKLNKLTYYNAEDSSIEFTLKAGDYICLPNNLVIYKVKHVNTTAMTVIIEEYIGHVALQTYTENSDMYLSLYNNDFSEFHYVNVPLEENQYIAIFLGTIYQNTRSLLSAPYLVDLSSIYMYDEYGNKILDNTGTPMRYTDYYNTYCTNIGDLLLGMTRAMHPQIASYDNSVLNTIENSDVIKELVNNSFFNASYEILPINKHIVDNTTAEEIIKMNAEKAEIQSQLDSLQTNIDTVYNALVTSDMSATDITTKLESYYNQRTQLNKQLNAVINNISAANVDTTITRDKLKYNVRGITKPAELEEYLQTISNDKKLTVIGLDVEYKYKAISNDVSTVSLIDGVIFTDWIKQKNIEKERILKFNDAGDGYNIEYVDYDDSQNIIKWNQIDVPVSQGEDVVIRVRYKYNIGQPFIDLYTPWSSEKTFVFPVEYSQTSELINILASNENDALAAKFNQTLTDGGYEKHVTNSITQNNITFFHQPENIYSGFNTPENNYISLKDKLQSMNSDIDNIKQNVNSELNKKYTISLIHDNTTTELYNNVVNKINVFNTEHISDSFVKNKLTLTIRNTGEVPVRLYSIFPGNIDIPLLLDNEEFYEQYLVHYERVPLFIANEIKPQTLGQWIYFRQDNPYTDMDIYYRNDTQDLEDYRAAVYGHTSVKYLENNTYIKENYNQMLLGYRRRTTGEVYTIGNAIIGLDFSSGECKQLIDVTPNSNVELNKLYGSLDESFYLYDVEDLSNNYLCRFEDISGVVNSGKKKGDIVYLDDATSISEFVASNTVLGLNGASATFVGAFLYPDLSARSTILINSNETSYKEIPVGGSLSIPITFEYYIDGETTDAKNNVITKITKALYFDIRDSLIGEPKHYLLELTANYDYSVTASVINSSSLIDDVVDY